MPQSIDTGADVFKYRLNLPSDGDGATERSNPPLLDSLRNKLQDERERTRDQRQEDPTKEEQGRRRKRKNMCVREEKEMRNHKGAAVVKPSKGSAKHFARRPDIPLFTGR